MRPRVAVPAGWLLAALLLALTGAIASAAPVAARSLPVAAATADCEPLDLTDPTELRAYAAKAGEVFVGQVRAAQPRRTVGGGAGQVEEPTDGTSTEEPERVGVVRNWQQTVDVMARFRGDVRAGDRVLVVTDPLPDGLGRLQVGQTYLFFVDGTAGSRRLTATACGGTTLIPGGLSAPLERALHEVLDEQETAPTPEVTLSSPDSGAAEPPSLSRLAAPGIALTLVGALGLLLVARLGSRRTS